MSERLSRDECTCAGVLIETNAHEAHCAVYGTARDGLRWTDGQTSLAARLADQAARLAALRAVLDQGAWLEPDAADDPAVEAGKRGLREMRGRLGEAYGPQGCALHPDPSEATP